MLEGFRLKRQTDEAPSLDDLSPSDIEALRQGYAMSRELSFNERTALTHDEDWEKARFGWMDYRDMVDVDNPRRDEIIEDLEEVGWRYAI